MDGLCDIGSHGSGATYLIAGRYHIRLAGSGYAAGGTQRGDA
jgi:hypothetical protein